MNEIQTDNIVKVMKLIDEVKILRQQVKDKDAIIMDLTQALRANHKTRRLKNYQLSLNDMGS